MAVTVVPALWCLGGFQWGGGWDSRDCSNPDIYGSSSGALYYDSNGSMVGGIEQFATLQPGRVFVYE